MKPILVIFVVYFRTMSENENQYIHIKGARVHNLKNVEVKIPRRKLIVITGLSGSGKSSLAFDTLYAEGQRRYVESLSSYARQFLGRMNKPEVDFIKGIPPAIAIEQKVNTRNPRSTVGTSTEIYDFMKLLFARIGKTYSPVSGSEVKKDNVEDVVDYLMAFDEGTRFAIYSPLIIPKGRSYAEQLDILNKQGYSRIERGGELYSITDELETESHRTIKCSECLILIDRMAVSNDQDSLSRIRDSVETAFFEGRKNCIVKVYQGDDIIEKPFSHRFEADGMEFIEPTEEMFSFNNPLGACPECEGFGKVIGIDEDLVIPNKNLSVYDDAVVCWKGEKMSEWKDELVYNASKFDFPVHTPVFKLTPEQRKLLWTGNKYFHGLHKFFKYLESKQYKIQYRVMLARYRGKTTCPSCNGTRLRKEASYVKVGGYAMNDLVNLSIRDLHEVFNSIEIDEKDRKVAKRLLPEIQNRLQFLLDVGLGYLTLNRLSNTLSGGESQRINLATSLGSSLVGSMYILDEPSIGLHSRDTKLLIGVLEKLKELGNTVIVVEHDEEIIEAADYIIDIGPDAGRLGGEITFQGEPDKLTGVDSYTAKYMTGAEVIPVPVHRRRWNNFIEIKGALENNLKGIDVRFPLGVMTVVTGVSGSGKSSLVKNILYPALKKLYGGSADKTGEHASIEGDIHMLKDIEFVDQNPIGKSSRSNPVTYLKAYDEIRALYASQKASKINGFKPSHFSFNVDGGRCDECQGEGEITIEMQFMADINLPCETCGGKRFKEEILDVKYNDLSIYDVLELTVDEAIDFFKSGKGSTEKKIVKKLLPLQEVGLGYIKLGQSSSTLSGGESQRVKLAFFLSKEKPDPTMFVFDEPTTGLHFHDISKLLEAFNALIRRGHSVLIIEHNMEVIKCADHIIDLGPEGGDMGGSLVITGTPEKVSRDEISYTAKFLAKKLN
ncbi:excinuclease ABC subunit UvrA [Saccharicrinis sp. FJH2]